MTTTYYIDGIAVYRLERVAKALDEKLDNGEEEITLKNGMNILVYRDSNRYQAYDEDLNLIAEYDNNFTGRINLANDMLRWACR